MSFILSFFSSPQSQTGQESSEEIEENSNDDQSGGGANVSKIGKFHLTTEGQISSKNPIRSTDGDTICN